MKMVLIPLLLFFCIVSMLASPACPDCYFYIADSSGQIVVDGGKSIQQAIECAGEGASILVSPGTYREAILIQAKKDLTLLGIDDDGEKPTIDVSLIPNTNSAVTIMDSKMITFGNFNIIAGEAMGMYIYHNGEKKMGEEPDISIENNTITDATNYGIMIRDNPAGVEDDIKPLFSEDDPPPLFITIQGNTIQRISAPENTTDRHAGTGIYANFNINLNVLNNLVEDTAGPGIELENVVVPPGETIPTIVQDNDIHRTKGFGISVINTILEDAEIIIVGNEVIDVADQTTGEMPPPGTGIHLRNNNNAITVENNLVENAENTAIFAHTGNVMKFINNRVTSHPNTGKSDEEYQEDPPPPPKHGISVLCVDFVTIQGDINNPDQFTVEGVFQTGISVYAALEALVEYTNVSIELPSPSPPVPNIGVTNTTVIEVGNATVSNNKGEIKTTTKTSATQEGDTSGLLFDRSSGTLQNNTFVGSTRCALVQCLDANCDDNVSDLVVTDLGGNNFCNEPVEEFDQRDVLPPEPPEDNQAEPEDCYAFPKAN